MANEPNVPRIDNPHAPVSDFEVVNDEKAGIYGAIVGDRERGRAAAVGEGELPDAAALSAATHIYWSSTAQFERGRQFASAAAWHASGAGKTAEHIRASGVRNFLAFPSVEEWRRWTAKAP